MVLYYNHPTLTVFLCSFYGDLTSFITFQEGRSLSGSDEIVASTMEVLCLLFQVSTVHAYISTAVMEGILCP